MKKILFPLFIILTVISSCTREPDFDVERRLMIEFFIENMGEEMIAGQDTLIINEFKFIVDRFKVETIDDSGIESTEQVRPFLFPYQRAFTNNILVFETALGISDIGAFNSYTGTVEKLRSTDLISDSDFHGGNETFSVVLRGEFNGALFEEKFKTNFDVTIDFLPVELTNRRETLLLVKSLDLRDIFVNEAAGTLLDPSVPENAPIFDELFKNSLRMSATSYSIFR